MDFMSFTSIILILFAIIGGYLIFTNQIEGRAKMILIVAVFIIFIIILINLPMFKSYTEFVASPVDAMQTHTIPGSSFTVTSSSYSVSTWIYINDWNVNYGQYKNIMSRIMSDGTANPSIQLDQFDNNLIIKYQTVNGSKQNPNTIDTPIVIPNVNIQKWVNITVCFGNQAIDTYINGKLIDTRVTNGAQNNIISSSASTNPGFTIGNGFSGSISNSRYYDMFLTPQKVWDIYNSGVNTNWLNQYNASFTFYQNQNVKAQFYLM